MSRFIKFMILVAAFSGLQTQLSAHGVDYEVIRGGIGIQAKYDDGQAISYSDFKVYRPGNVETPYQQGLTDKYGRFLFIPDTSGNWKVEVDDGMGHGLVEKIAITENMTLTKGLEHKHLNRYQDLLIGISIIFGITGIAYYFAAKKKYPEISSAPEKSANKR